MDMFQDNFLHGADYNPDQWLNDEEVLLQDIKFLKGAKINFVSLGIFSWAQLEVEEGVFHFDWMDRVIERLHRNEINIVLATPSGSKPAWISNRYPEVCRVDKRGKREIHGNRHNHCMTSPVYRERVRLINEELSRRYGKHPGVILWHISNEYSGHCYCELCIGKFRNFLRDKYKTIDHLNRSWWNAFWSHSFNDFKQINPPMEHGEKSNIALQMDWNRFTTLNTIDFYNHEVEAIRKYSNRPATTNFFGGLCLHLDYFEFAKHVDIVAYDSYPLWHSGDDYKEGIRTSLVYDLMRSLKGNRSFLLMESTPSTTNWRAASKLKRPGMHELASIQAVAHGSDMVGYFQLRKSRGQCEKFHSAVIDHASSYEHRIFQEVRQVGEKLGAIKPILGGETNNTIALYMDWSNSNAIASNIGPRMCGMNYTSDLEAYYSAIVSQGYGVDFVNFESDLEGYQLLVLPMVYSAPDSFWQRISRFVEEGGKIITTYMCGYADENDLIYKSGRNEYLSSIIGLRYSEIDGLEEGDLNSTIIFEDSVEIRELCEININKEANTLAVYEEDFYKGKPVITEKEGNYHIAARIDDWGLRRFFKTVIPEMGVERIIDLQDTKLLAAKREKVGKEYIFLMNFTKEAIEFELEEGVTDLFSGETGRSKTLEKYGYIVLKKGA
jgi:beta-galactosidase